MVPDDYYQVGGSLGYRHPTYVERQADLELYQSLQQGHYCYVLNSRQMGKSSLRVQVMKRLTQEGYKCSSVDITGIGSQVTPTEWYGAIVSELLRGFRLSRQIDFKTWWRQREQLSPVQRFKEFLEDILLTEFEQEIIIFIDEIDSILRVPFKDDFFAFIRACYNYRADCSAYRRLTFCLLGVATPTNLIQQTDRTPFNIGRPIALAGLTFNQAAVALVPGFSHNADDAMAVLAAILAWTGGQPFLTQKVCRLVQLAPERIWQGTEADRVTQLIQTHILTHWEAQDEPEHLRTIRDRILNQPQTGQLLGLYQQILVHEATGIRADNSLEQTELCLTGLVVRRGGQLQLYNRIYAAVFNQEWLQHMLGKLRPYAAALATWVASDEQDPACLLRGNALLAAQIWAADKRLGTQDYRFLAASQDLAQQEIQTILQREQRSAQVLAVANRQAKRRIQIGSAILALCLSCAILAGLLASETLGQRQLAQAGARLEQAGVSALQQFESRQIDGLLSALQAGQELRALTQDQPLEQYPAQSPLFALQQILNQISEKNQLQANQGRVLGLTFSPDGQTVATAGQDGTVKIWPIASPLPQGTQGLTLQQHQGWVRRVQFSSDLQYLATAGFDHARLWNRAGDLLAELTGHQGSVMDVAFSPDRSFLATAGQDGTVRFWDLTGQSLQVLMAHPHEIHALSISPDSQLLAMAGLDGVSLWTRSGQQLWFKPWPWIRSVQFSPDGQQLAIAGAAGGVLLDLSSHRITQLQPLSAPVRHITFSSDGQQVATTSNDGTVRLWHRSGRFVGQLNGHQGTVNAISLSLDGIHIATAGDDGTVRLWQPHQLPMPQFNGHQDEIYSIQFSPDGQQLVTAGQDRTARLWNLSGQQQQIFQGHQGRVKSAAMSPDGQLVATAGFEDAVRIWRQDGSLLRELERHQGDSASVVFSPNGQQLAVSGENTAQVWSLNGDLLFELKDHLGRVKDICFSGPMQATPRSLIATADSDGTVRLWDRSGKFVHQIKAHAGVVHSVRFSPDGDILATAGADGVARLWHRSGQALRELKGHTGMVTSVRFSPDGQLIATAGEDGTVRLWTRTGTLVATYPEQGPLSSLSFSPDGRTLATVGTQGIVRLLPVMSLDRLITAGCQWLQDYFASHPEAQQVCHDRPVS